MNTQGNEELITRWIDGDLNEEHSPELVQLLQEQPELRGMREAAVGVGQHLREHVADLPHKDFFTSQLIRRIERDETTVAPTEATTRSSWFGEIGRWLLPTAFAALTAGFFVGRSANDVPEKVVGNVQTLEVYTPGQGISAELVNSSRDQPAVIVLSGMAAIPDSVDIASLSKELDSTSRMAGLSL